MKHKYFFVGTVLHQVRVCIPVKLIVGDANQLDQEILLFLSRGNGITFICQFSNETQESVAYHSVTRTINETNFT